MPKPIGRATHVFNKDIDAENAKDKSKRLMENEALCICVDEEDESWTIEDKVTGEEPDELKSIEEVYEDSLSITEEKLEKIRIKKEKEKEELKIKDEKRKARNKRKAKKRKMAKSKKQKKRKTKLHRGTCKSDMTLLPWTSLC
jgi:hypothetical protein